MQLIAHQPLKNKASRYLLDGHHKVFASHKTGKPMTMLSFISVDHSWQLVDKLIEEYEKNK